MSSLDEILKLNPRAATGLGTIRQTLSDLEALRDAGVIRKPIITRPDGGKKSLGELKAAQRAAFLK